MEQYMGYIVTSLLGFGLAGSLLMWRYIINKAASSISEEDARNIIDDKFKGIEVRLEYTKEELVKINKKIDKII